MDLGDEEQKKRWIPKLATGEPIPAIAMTEPGTGSDLRGIATRGVKVDGAGLDRQRRQDLHHLRRQGRW
jgi:alkylation response protein AidB-like acyl-CoA dehydrogenase